MNLTTTSGAACTWTVSPTSLVVKVTSGKDRVWSSQDCPSGVPTQSVAVRPANEQATQVIVTWSGQRSTKGCAKGQPWADPGSYHVVAASLGGEPTDVQFQLVAPSRPTVTKTAKPKKQPSKQPTGTASKKPRVKVTATPVATNTAD